jgi:hypothetical protein
MAELAIEGIAGMAGRAIDQQGYSAMSANPLAA